MHNLHYCGIDKSVVGVTIRGDYDGKETGNPSSLEIMHNPSRFNE
jgi:hypothetical protein